MAGPADSPSTNAKAFDCPNCGGQVKVLVQGHSLSCVCSHCQTIIDVSDENHRIIQKASKQRKVKPLIPIGQRGTLDGIEWEMIGFMVRRDTQWGFSWQEYLLFNPWYGYRFLVVSDGHWSLVETVVEEETAKKTGFALFDGDIYKYHSNARAQVMYVEGEFYWEVKRNEKSNTSDYVRPPYILSAEWDQSGMVWSQGRYIEPAEVRKAFDLKSLPGRVGVGANQPNKYRQNLEKIGLIAAIFIGVVIMMYLFLGNSGEGSNAFQSNYTQNTKDTTFVSPPFEIQGGTNNVEVKLRSDVSNNWLEVYGDLRNVETNVTYSFQLTTEYYYGYTDGESWSEGGNYASIVINSVPAGTYELIANSYADVDKNSSLILKQQVNYSLQVVREVPILSNLIIILILLAIYPVYLLIASIQFENRRFAD